MSEIKRYTWTEESYPPDGMELVAASDHDAAIAALTEDLAVVRKNYATLTQDFNEARAQGLTDFGIISMQEAHIAALIADCNVICNALQRIEAGEPEPRMIARRTLEHWSEKAALAAAETEVKP
jgi:hypothetical protein